MACPAELVVATAELTTACVVEVGVEPVLAGMVALAADEDSDLGGAEDDDDGEDDEVVVGAAEDEVGAALVVVWVEG